MKMLLEGVRVITPWNKATFAVRPSAHTRKLLDVHVPEGARVDSVQIGAITTSLELARDIAIHPGAPFNVTIENICPHPVGMNMVGLKEKEEGKAFQEETVRGAASSSRVQKTMLRDRYCGEAYVEVEEFEQRAHPSVEAAAFCRPEENPKEGLSILAFEKLSFAAGVASLAFQTPEALSLLEDVICSGCSLARVVVLTSVFEGASLFDWRGMVLVPLSTVELLFVPVGTPGQDAERAAYVKIRKLVFPTPQAPRG